jgi:hypothetical protein
MGCRPVMIRLDGSQLAVGREETAAGIGAIYLI